MLKEKIRVSVVGQKKNDSVRQKPLIHDTHDDMKKMFVSLTSDVLFSVFATK